MLALVLAATLGVIIAVTSYRMIIARLAAKPADQQHHQDGLVRRKPETYISLVGYSLVKRLIQLLCVAWCTVASSEGNVAHHPPASLCPFVQVTWFNRLLYEKKVLEYAVRVTHQTAIQAATNGRPFIGDPTTCA